jgi:hypothetical protein
LNNAIIEIQTGNYSSIKTKITKLVSDYNLKLVFPITAEKWLLKYPEDKSGRVITRKSPKKSRKEEIFSELVSFPELLCSKRFSIEIAMAKEQKVRVYTGEKLWRQHGWATVERQLLEIIETCTYQKPSDLLGLLPLNMPDCFTTGDITLEGKIPHWLAQKMAYSLRNMGTIVQIGKKGCSYLYSQSLGENFTVS